MHFMCHSNSKKFLQKFDPFDTYRSVDQYQQETLIWKKVEETKSPRSFWVLQSYLDFPHISGYPPKDNRNNHFFWLCHLSSGTCGLPKKTKNKKILLKFFHLYHFLGKKRAFLALFKQKIIHTVLKILENTGTVWQ